METMNMVVQTCSCSSIFVIDFCGGFFKLVMIDCRQHVGNESCQNTADEPNNMKEKENYGTSERENDVHEIGVFGSSSESGEIPVTSDDFWHSLEISSESSLDGEVGKRLNQMVPIAVSVASVQLLAAVFKVIIFLFSP